VSWFGAAVLEMFRLQQRKKKKEKKNHLREESTKVKMIGEMFRL
jgi:hypothetical protein